MATIRRVILQPPPQKKYFKHEIMSVSVFPMLMAVHCTVYSFVKRGSERGFSRTKISKEGHEFGTGYTRITCYITL